MTHNKPRTLEERVYRAAETALAERQFVTVIDVLVGVGWLPMSSVNMWRQGRVDCLEAELQVNPNKLLTALKIFRMWAENRELQPMPTTYLSRSPEPQELRFTWSGDAELEDAYRTHWVSPELSDSKKERLAQQQNQAPELVVISALKAWTCSKCGAGKDAGEFLVMEPPGPICMRCASMDHLYFLAAGDARLTRTARRISRLSPVVVRFSRSRKRYERQGILIEEEALDQAERECLSRQEAESRRRMRRKSGQEEMGPRPNLEVLQGAAPRRER